MAPAEADRAVWFEAPWTVAIRPEPRPAVGPADVRVRAIVSGISHGTEMLVYRGQVPPDLPLDLPTLRGSFAFPIKYGYACVGRVVEAGAAVTDVGAGDLVFCLHPHQDQFVVPAGLITRLPAGLDPAAGVFTANLETAINVVLDAAPRFGERALVSGLGVVGQLIARLLGRVGLDWLGAVDPIEARRNLARSAGVHDLFPPGLDLPAWVRAKTDGAGADLAIEVSGHPAALDAAIRCLAPAGTVVVASWYGTKPVTLDLGSSFHRGRLRIVSSQVGAIAPSLQPRWTPARRLDLATRLLRELDLAPLITHRLPFDRAADAYRLIDEAPAETVQVVLDYPDAGRAEAFEPPNI